MTFIESKPPASVVGQKTGRYNRDLCRDRRTTAAKDLPVNGPLVRLKLGLGVKGHADRGISCRRGRRDVNLWALGVLLSGACHLSTHERIRKEGLVIRLRCGWGWGGGVASGRICGL